jgi:hypothetical protein
MPSSGAEDVFSNEPIATDAPASAIAKAIARPMPEAPPEISATFPQRNLGSFIMDKLKVISEVVDAAAYGVVSG